MGRAEISVNSNLLESCWNPKKINNSLTVLKNNMFLPVYHSIHPSSSSHCDSVDSYPKIKQFNYFASLCTELLLYIFSFCNELDLVQLQTCSRKLRQQVQVYATRLNLINITVGNLLVTQVKSFTLPVEREDIWNDPLGPPHFLPQSRLQGRCAALLYYDDLQNLEITRTGLIDLSEFISHKPQKKSHVVNTHQESMISNTHLVTASRNRAIKRNSAHVFPPDYGRMLICGGYGMFELYDHDIPMRCNEVWEYGIREQKWAHPVPMTEDFLMEEDRLRFEDRDSVILSGDHLQLLVFGQAAPGNSCHHIFDRISILEIPRPQHDSERSTWGVPFDSAEEWPMEPFMHFTSYGDIPRKRECFASVLWRPPGDGVSGLLCLYGGFTPHFKCLSDLYLLEIPLKPQGTSTLAECIPENCFTWHNVSSSKLDNRNGSKNLEDPELLNKCNEKHPGGRFGHTMTMIGKRMFLFGGKSDRFGVRSPNGTIAMQLMQDVWKLEHKNSASQSIRSGWIWTEIACTGCAPAARSSHRAVAIGMKLLIFGGFTSRYVNDMFTLNTGNFIWSQVNFDAISKEVVVTHHPNKRQKKSYDMQMLSRVNRQIDTIDTAYNVSQRHFTRGRQPITAHLRLADHGYDLYSQITKTNNYDPVFYGGYTRTTRNGSSTQKKCIARSTPKLMNTSQPKTIHSIPISKRMEASLLYDKKRALCIFGGSKRYRWNCSQLRFDDFCSDMFAVELSASSNSEHMECDSLSIEI